MTSNKTRAERIIELRAEAESILIDLTLHAHDSIKAGSARHRMRLAFAEALALPPDPPRGDGWDALRELRSQSVHESAQEIRSRIDIMLAATPKEPEPSKQVVVDIDNRRAATHECMICGTLWRCNDDQSWSLLGVAREGAPGKCCDNVAMGDQIRSLSEALRVVRLVTPKPTPPPDRIIKEGAEAATAPKAGRSRRHQKLNCLGWASDMEEANARIKELEEQLKKIQSIINPEGKES